MSPDISLTGVVLSSLLPWLLGSTWVYWLLGRSERWNHWLIAGYGYLVGLFLTTLGLRLWSLCGIPLNFNGLAAALAGLTLAGAGLAWRQPARRRPATPAVGRAEPLIVALLLGLLALRYGTILQEVVLRPLYPWDAWMNWAPKAVVWFHYRELVDFVHPLAWMQAPATELDYTLGAFEAWKYPDGIPLIQLWGMLGAGTADTTLVYLPWVFVSIALGFTLYGTLRLLALPAYLSMIATYLLLSIPFLNVHTALAGYADSWVAALFGCSVFAVIAWDETRRWPYLVIALVLALFCAQLKVPGLIMAAIALALLVITLPGLKRQWLVLLLGAGIAALVAVFMIEPDFVIPGMGRVSISRELIALPYIGQHPLEYHPVHAAMLTANFLMLNWNILWYLVLPALAILALRPAHLANSFIAALGLILSCSFVLFVYYFTDRYKYALDYTQVNRATIYTIPIAVLLLATSFHGASRKGSKVDTALPGN